MCIRDRSSSFSPSRSDVQMTKKVLVTLNAIDVNLLDHLIISDNGYYSFVQDGKINTVLEHGQVAYAADREVCGWVIGRGGVPYP